jgi:hypothetical protein
MWCFSVFGAQAAPRLEKRWGNIFCDADRAGRVAPASKITAAC